MNLNVLQNYFRGKDFVFKSNLEIKNGHRGGFNKLSTIYYYSIHSFLFVILKNIFIPFYLSF